MTGPNIHREVLDNLEDGVLVVGSGGRIETLNPAAERILGLEAGQATGRTFVELFIAREGFDDFTQLILDATAKNSGDERRVVEVQGAGAARSLSVATSYLKRTDAAETAAAIAVFSDITELRELRDTELRMAQAAEEQHRRLQDAYREIEERNGALAAALRKVRVVQGLGTLLAIGLFLGAGLWTWRPLDLFDRAAAVAASGPSGTERRMTVPFRPVSSSISLRGTLAPWRTMALRSPVDGTLVAVYFRTGQEVSKGETLLETDLTRVKRDYATRRRSHATALQRFRELGDWEASPEMTKARRSFVKARLDRESQRTKINKSRFLFKEGLVSASEFEDAERQHKSQELDFEAAEEEFAAIRAKASEEALEAARLDLESARADLLAAEEALAHDRVLAPIAGVVLAPERAGQEPIPGKAIRAGEVLLRIGDFSRMAAAVKVDEADVVQLRAGQKVTVTGNAFRGLTLRGEVSHVSSQADPRSMGIPKFDVTVTLDPVRPEDAARLRAGMSAQLRVVTYSNPKALLVPIDAVESRAGAHRLRVVDPDTGEVEEREVQIGPTTQDSVEIRAGLAAGETILLPEG